MPEEADPRRRLLDVGDLIDHISITSVVSCVEARGNFRGEVQARQIIRRHQLGVRSSRRRMAPGNSVVNTGIIQEAVGETVITFTPAPSNILTDASDTRSSVMTQWSFWSGQRISPAPELRNFELSASTTSLFA